MNIMQKRDVYAVTIILPGREHSMKITTITWCCLLGVLLFTACGDDDTTQPGIFDGIAYRGLVSVPGGTFTQKATMGTPDSFEHTISAFSMGKYEVTYELWFMVKAWAEDNGYTFANDGQEGSNGTGGAEPTAAEHEPVANISWRDAMVWCNAYSEMAGLTPVYIYNSDIIQDASDANACDNAVAGWSEDGYRLPTEGEWQYAASYIDGSDWLPFDHVSGDASAPYDTSTVVGDFAWYKNNSDTGDGWETHTVGTKTANHRDIHDMSGNVYEWCWDIYADYPLTAQTDYRGGSGSHHIFRGGCYSDPDSELQVGFRLSGSTDLIHESIGFRVARSQ